MESISAKWLMMQYKLKMWMLKILQWLPMTLNLMFSLMFLGLVLFPNLITFVLFQSSLILLMVGCIVLWVISHALKYCIWHRLYIYLLLLFLITISIWFCDIVFIVHGVLLLILIGLCVYFKKGLC
jgi:hypothetical protein